MPSKIPSTNKHGLSRHIPEDVARTVRQRDGFGCVVCGSAFYTYEHVDPTFADATEHEAKNITLLCWGCHDRVNRRQLSKETVKACQLKPKCLERGYSHGAFDIGTKSPEVRIGKLIARDIPVLLEIMGDALLQVEPPEVDGGPFLLSAVLSNRRGDEVLRIVKNEWQTPASNWDVKVKGPRIIIHNKSRDVALLLRSEPPHALAIERINMYHKGAKIIASPDGAIEIKGLMGEEIVTDGFFEGFRILIQVTEKHGVSLGVNDRRPL